jgi:hypothetical protein
MKSLHMIAFAFSVALSTGASASTMSSGLDDVGHSLADVWHGVVHGTTTVVHGVGSAATGVWHGTARGTQDVVHGTSHVVDHSVKTVKHTTSTVIR